MWCIIRSNVTARCLLFIYRVFFKVLDFEFYILTKYAVHKAVLTCSISVFSVCKQGEMQYTVFLEWTQILVLKKKNWYIFIEGWNSIWESWMMSGVRLVVKKRAVTGLFWLQHWSSLIKVKNVGIETKFSVFSRESALWLRLPRCRALQVAEAFVFFMLFSSEWVRVGTVLVGGSCKRIPLHMYKRSGAVCNGSDCEIPLASEESRNEWRAQPRLYF